MFSVSLVIKVVAVLVIILQHVLLFIHDVVMGENLGEADTALMSLHLVIAVADILVLEEFLLSRLL